VTRGSKIHDALGEHLRGCARCRGASPEEARLRQPAAHRHDVPEATLATLCPVGLVVYQAYLRWLASPDE
jgi:hypothetical protein